jgi:hypothetical protein
MLGHLKIILQFHAHPVHQKVSRFFGQRYIGDDFFLGPNLVSFNRAVVPLLELSFLTKSQKLTSGHWVLQVREFCQTYQLFARPTFFEKFFNMRA